MHIIVIHSLEVGESSYVLRAWGQVREKIFIIWVKFMKILEYLGTMMIINLKNKNISYDPLKAIYLTACGQTTLKWHIFKTLCILKY